MKTEIPSHVIQWNVLYTKPGMERKVAEALTNKNIKHYLPVKKSSAPWWNLKRTVATSVFPSIVFVRTSHKQRAEIKQINGVVNFLYWLGNPAIIRDQEITTIKVFLNTHKNVTVQKSVVNLKFTDNESTENPDVDKIVYSDEFKVDIPTLGYSMTAEGVSSNIRYIKTERLINELNLDTRLSNAS